MSKFVPLISIEIVVAYPTNMVGPYCENNKCNCKRSKNLQFAMQPGRAKAFAEAKCKLNYSVGLLGRAELAMHALKKMKCNSKLTNT